MSLRGISIIRRLKTWNSKTKLVN